MAEVINLNMFGGETPQVSVMPTPSPELAGKILQYAGATDGNFTAGYFYRCVTADGVSSWQRVNVQPSAAGISWGGIDGDISDQTDLAAVLNAKTGKMNVTFVVNTTEQLATKTAATGDTAVVKTTGKLHTYDGEAWDGGVNGEYGVIYIAENEQYMWDTSKFVLISTDNAMTLNGKSESYFAKESEVAKKDGRYPLMNVGSANNLMGGMKVTREFIEDPAGGSVDIADSIVRVERIKGNTILWNQNKVRLPNLYNVTQEEQSDGSFRLMPNGSKPRAYVIVSDIYASGHKYYISIEVRVSEDQKATFGISNISHAFVSGKYKETTSTEFVRLSFIDSFAFSNNLIEVECNYDGGEIYYKHLMCIDLTKMFGAGNEPATVAEFVKMFPLDYYDYNVGQLLSLNPTGIKTVGFNAYNHVTGKAYVIGGHQYQITGVYTSITEDGVTITPDSNGKFTPTKNGELMIAGGDSTTTCVHLVWSGKRDGEYEEHWEETRNIPVAQINTDGTITENAEGKTRLFPDGLCSVGEYIDDVTPVKAIKRIGARAYEEEDKEDISVLTDGTTTLYVLATPVVVEFTEPLNLNYRVSDFGTETLLPINGATPVTTAIKMDVEYGLNVVDTVRNLSHNYLGMTGTQNTFAVIASALSAYGMSMTLGDYDETNKYYPVTISGGWKPANAAPASATAAGNKGEYYIDADYFYVCVDDATWKRFALSSW